MNFSLQTPLKISADTAWQAVKQPRSLVYVCRGLVSLPAAQFPGEGWVEGLRIQLRPRLFHLLPTGWLHTTVIRQVDDGQRILQADESGPFYAWRLAIHVEPAPGGCLVRDEIEVRAGWLTPLAWLWLGLFHLYRQGRWRRLTGIPRHLPGRAAWAKVLQARHGPETANRLLDRAEEGWRMLMFGRRIVTNHALRQHLEDHLLPALAIYRVLSEETGDREAALSEVEALLEAGMLPQFKFQAFLLKGFPKSFALLRFSFGPMMRSYPAEGWEMEWLENSPRRIAFNTHRCFYLDTLRTLGAAELTAAFCQMDDVGGRLMPPSIRFVRSQALGRGGKMCDFQYLEAH